jgi:hypothetical protein
MRSFNDQQNPAALPPLPSFQVDAGPQLKSKTATEPPQR